LKGGEQVTEPKKFEWKNREADLEATIRFHMIKTMFYRTDHLLHSRRVAAIVKELLPAAIAVYPDLNPNLALAISKYHDDHEMFTGDTSLQLKLLMNNGEILKFKQKEIAAAEHMIKSYRNPLIGKFRYRDLLMWSILKNSREAQLHSFADKVEGFSEAVHELLAGNTVFIEPVINYISQTFNDLPASFPLIRDVFVKGSMFCLPVVGLPLREYFHLGVHGYFMHTPETIQLNTGIHYYELWKGVTGMLEGGVRRLTTQVEFYPHPELKLVAPPESVSEEFQHLTA
jgi:5'-deoxynucleotidase YfbR-like HD superfamily hydrolase